MVSDNAKVTLEVAVQTQQEQIDELEARMRQLQQEKIQVSLDAHTEELEQVTQEIEETRNRLSDLKASVTVDNTEIAELESELADTQSQLDYLKGNVELDNSEIAELESELESAQSELESLNGDVNVDSSEVEALEDYITDLESQLEDLQANVTVDSSEIEELESHATELESQLEELNSKVTVDNTEIDDLESKLTELEATQLDLQIQCNKDEIDAAKVSMDDLKSSTDDASNSTDNLNSSLGMLDTMAVFSVSEALAGYGGEAEQMAQDMNNAAISVGQLATQTGIAEPQMVSLINHISNATFPNEEAMMYVKSLDQIGVAAGNLGQSATDLDKINDAFGLGAEKVNSLGQELSVLGVDMNDVSSSFNALAYANANTVGGMDNYYNFLRKYDAQFKELGYNVDQASIIIAGATQKFGGGRAALSGLSEALKEANGDSRKLEEALGLQAGALDNASQITGQYEGQLQKLADEEAEHKSILDQIGAAWEDISLSLSPLLSSMASFMGLIGQAGSWAVGVNGMWELGNKLRELSIVDSISGKFSGFKGKLSGLGTSIGNIAKGLGSGLVNALKTVASGFSSLFTVLMANPIVLVIAAIVALVAILIYLYYTNEDVRNAINGFIDTLKGIGDVIYGSVMGAIDWLNGAWHGLVDLFTSTGDSIHDTVTGTFQWLADSVTGSVGWLVDTAKAKWQELIDWLTSGAQYISDSVTGAFNWLGESLNEVLTWISDSFTSTFEYINEVFQGTVDWLTSGAQLISDSLTGAFQGLYDTWNTVVEAFNTYAPLIAQVLLVMATGGVGAIVLLVANFMGMPNQVGQALQNVINRVTGFVSDLINKFVSGARDSVNNFITKIKEMPIKFKQELDKMIEDAKKFVTDLPNIIARAAGSMVLSWTVGSGEHSPGFMYDAFYGELSAMQKLAKSTDIDMKSTAKDMVKSWGNPNLTYTIELDKVKTNNTEDNENNNSIIDLLTKILTALTVRESKETNTIVNTNDTNVSRVEDLLTGILNAVSKNTLNNVTFNHYGDTDDEEKLQKILDFIIREINWNNETAGRDTSKYGV